MNIILRQFMMLLVICSLFSAPFSYAQKYSHDRTIYTTEISEAPKAETMVVDLVLGRPILFLTTLAGTAVFLVSLPFTTLAGDVATPRRKLIDEPATATFNRCLGCPMTQF